MARHVTVAETQVILPEIVHKDKTDRNEDTTEGKEQFLEAEDILVPKTPDTIITTVSIMLIETMVIIIITKLIIIDPSREADAEIADIIAEIIGVEGVLSPITIKDTKIGMETIRQQTPFYTRHFLAKDKACPTGTL